MAVAQDSRLQHSLKMEPGIERPQSALARGVQITEFKESYVNPEPIVLEETELMMEQFLSPTKLRLLTGVDNLDDIFTLEMKVNTTDTSVGNFGLSLPNLRQLRVSNSTIPLIRDLGSSLRNLNVLWASRCCLKELDGLSSMCNLRELYLSYNEIRDISPISMLDQLEILDLEGNSLEDIVQVQYLTICSKLTNLTLDGNPLCVAPPGEDPLEYDYRQLVKKAIPHLQILDDEPLIEGVCSFQKHNVFDDDWAYIAELQSDVLLEEEDDSVPSSVSSRPGSGSRPSTAILRPNTGYKPGTALRPNTGFRPLTTSRRPATIGSIRPSTAVPSRLGSGSNRPQSEDSRRSTEEQGRAETSDTSDLTLGKVICGNPSKALMSRRRLNPDQKGELEDDQHSKFEPTFHHKAEHTYDPVPEENTDREDIVAELLAWRSEHEVRMEKIRAERAPQVLVIDHDDAVSLSGDSEVDSDDDDYHSYVTPKSDGRVSTSLTDRLAPSVEDRLSEEPSVSSYVSRDRNASNDHRSHKIQSRDKDSMFKSKTSPSNDSTFKTSPSNDSTFNMSAVATRHKTKIPPPNERDIVRKSLGPVEGSSSPILGSQTVNSIRSSSPMSALKVNNSGLPPPPSASINIPRSRLRSSEGLDKPLRWDPAAPVMRSMAIEKPIAPPTQRPSTARAVLAIPANPRIRRQLPTAPSLPSKPHPPPK